MQYLGAIARTKKPKRGEGGLGGRGHSNFKVQVQEWESIWKELTVGTRWGPSADVERSGRCSQSREQAP